MMCWSVATVIDCDYERAGLQVVRVALEDGTEAQAHHYTGDWERIKRGDRVLLNTTAVELGLGSGGFHYVHCILNEHTHTIRTKRLAQHSGHIMKQRYTSLQRAVLTVEEEHSPYHELFLEHKTLEHCPVLIGELHSMVPIAVNWFRSIGDRPLNIVYVMSDGGALPLVLSDHIAALHAMRWLRGTLTYGQAYGGELEAINKFTALLAARHIYDADVIIVTMGPGIAGTGTKLGHSGVEVGELINAVSILEGTPIAIPRISFADKRQRHRGLSHHTMMSLQHIALRKALIPMPQLSDRAEKNTLTEQIELAGWQHKHEVRWIEPPSVAQIQQSFASYPLKITTMGRTVEEDPAFFKSVCAAVQVGWSMIRPNGKE